MATVGWQTTKLMTSGTRIGGAQAPVVPVLGTAIAVKAMMTGMTGMTGSNAVVTG